MNSSGDIRCTCQYHPILAKYGRSRDNQQIFIHVKVFRGGKIWAEVVVTGQAVVRIFCRSCYRWHRLFITDITQEPKLRLESNVGRSFPGVTP